MSTSSDATSLKHSLTALTALEDADLAWTRHIKSVWEDLDGDVEGMHPEVRGSLRKRLQSFYERSSPHSPLGTLLLGASGSGKTHLLSVLRSEVIPQGFHFVLVDMSGVRDFWEIVLEAYLDALQKNLDDINGSQLERLLTTLLKHAGCNLSLQALANQPHAQMLASIEQILRGLGAKHRAETIRFQDVMRALILLNAGDFAASAVGHSWLQGQELEAHDKQHYAFRQAVMARPRVLQGLSWVMSLYGPTLLAFDQFDAIIAEHHALARGCTNADQPSAEQQTSAYIIASIANGLMELRDLTSRTLTLVAALAETWQALNTMHTRSFAARFDRPLVLGDITREALFAQMIQHRLHAAYQRHELVVPYPGWPFHATFFASAALQGCQPREVLQRCDQHVKYCRERAAIWELTDFDHTAACIEASQDLSALDLAFKQAYDAVDTISAHYPDYEDEILGSWLQNACRCLLSEYTILAAIDTQLDVDLSSDKRYPPLHARLKLIFRTEQDRERHLCMRALLHTHPSAYKARLKAAMTMSGIDAQLGFRRLLIAHIHDLPTGPATQRLTQECKDAGGLFVSLQADELRTLGALQQLANDDRPDFDSWLKQRRPVSRLPCMHEAVSWLFADTSPAPSDITATDTYANAERTAENATAVTMPSQTSSATTLEDTGFEILDRAETVTASTTTLDHASDTEKNALNEVDNHFQSEISRPDLPYTPTGTLFIGQRLMGDEDLEPIRLPLTDLNRHTVILAGSGAGKTVLLRRIVEEAILEGVPVIVIDAANDLARLGDPWPHTPQGWCTQDAQRALQYHHAVDIHIWTPGREAGRPMTLPGLPDFAALLHDKDELGHAIDMVCASLEPVVAAGRSHNAQLRQAILRKGISYMAHHGSGRAGNLQTLVNLLDNLPAQACGQISQAEKHGQQMADLMRAELANNPLLRASGTPLDPGLLFGLGQEKTHLSIINFIGLAELSRQQQFLNQLVMSLFGWIKRHPAPPERPLRGLLVIDEAKDFVPSQHSTPCKQNLMRLAAQARKYGLGLVFATQAPRSMDHHIIANCTTHFYGRANSRAAIDTVREQLRMHGRSINDIAHIPPGQFYVVSNAIHPPERIRIPMCLSYHPETPLDDAAILKRAQYSARRAKGLSGKQEMKP